MAIESINPLDGSRIESFNPTPERNVATALEIADTAWRNWAALALDERAKHLHTVARLLRARASTLGAIITREMGKLAAEARSEVEKCALVCDYYADHAAAMLADRPLPAKPAQALLTYRPLGVIMAIMPWNFPFWQVFRCAAPTLMAGNTVLLKHASNVSRCALSIAELFAEAGFPPGAFQALLISGERASELLRDRRIRGVSLTGSEAAGRKVAAIAGEGLKPSVLELGGSDAFVVLADADLGQAVEQAVKSRFLNAGQSCIAAKRFIVVEAIADDFVARLVEAAAQLNPGDPADPATTLAPLARADLRAELHRQVGDSVRAGARVCLGARPLERPGWFYPATVLDRVGCGMPAYEDELFGPVAAVIRATDEADALRIANDSRFGLGGSVWSRDPERGAAFARRIACGNAFVNGMVRSDPRLPFGGIGDSGYGRELGEPGIHAFVNAKTLWIGSADT